MTPNTIEKLQCFHCGDDCNDELIKIDDKVFCCDGCKLVYELLAESNLCTYYTIDQHPGISQKQTVANSRFDFLDDDVVVKKLISFRKENQCVVQLTIPKMHCTSCIWLLENLSQLDAGVIQSTVNFNRRELVLRFDETKTSLKKIVVLLKVIGYEPTLSFDSLEHKSKKQTNRKLIYQLGITGFCFGNIMLLSFPEYLSAGTTLELKMKSYFGLLNLILALPVFFFGASDFFINSWQNARKKIFSIDLPIALGLAVIFFKSTYDIVGGTGAGYFDSMTGLVFFLLIGRFIQSKTYDSLSFERNYKSYFPIAVTKIRKNAEEQIPLENLREGDKILIRNNELIPADCFLISGDANIDYSFVTGESETESASIGNHIYAGGKQIGSSIIVQIQKPVEQSYLTQLWNHRAFQKKQNDNFSVLANTISKYFTIAILIIAVATGCYWYLYNPLKLMNAVVSVLVIACPCALAITIPFTFGNVMSIFGRNKFYIRNTQVIEHLAGVSHLVFDKTGTITHTSKTNISFYGNNLTENEINAVASLASSSNHPLSKKIKFYLSAKSVHTITGFKEQPGFGIEGIYNDKKIKLGSELFVCKHANSKDNSVTRVYVSVDDDVKGYFSIENNLRPGFEKVFNRLQKKYDLSLISGDGNADRGRLSNYFKMTHLFFNQKPIEKLKYIETKQQQHEHVAMIGDGLNDAGALKQADVGIVITEDTSMFCPGADAIIDAQSFEKLPAILSMANGAVKIIFITFILSLVYNVAGIYFAITGQLTPLIAAILMPLSSFSVIIITTLSTKLLQRKLHL